MLPDAPWFPCRETVDHLLATRASHQGSNWACALFYGTSEWALRLDSPKSTLGPAHNTIMYNGQLIRDRRASDRPAGNRWHPWKDAATPKPLMSFLMCNAKAAGARAGAILALSLVITLIVVVEIPGLTQWRLAEGDRIRYPVRAPRDVFTRQPVPRQERLARLATIQQFLQQVEQARKVDGPDPLWADIAVPGLSDTLIPLLQNLSSADRSRLHRVVMETLTAIDDQVITEGNLEQTRLYTRIILQERLADPQLVHTAQMLVLPWIRPNTLTTAYAVGEEIASPAMPLTRGQMAVLSQLDMLYRVWFPPRFFLILPLVCLLLTLLQWVVPLYNRHIMERKRELWALAGFILLLLLAVKIQVHQATWVRYMLPVAAAGMLLWTLAGFRVALVVGMTLVVITGFMSRVDLGFLLFMTLGMLAGVVALHQNNRIRHFVTAGIWVAAMNLLLLVPMALNVHAPLTLVTQLPDPDLRTWFQGPLLLAFVSLVNGLTSFSIALAGTYAFGELTGRVTSFKLSELARPDHPLLVLLRNEAPGTYHHTMRVSDMAERTAQVIGADALLTRADAYYHDIGKIPQAYLFAENIPPGQQPHADYSPAQSACIVIGHVAKGLQIGREYGLPPRILDFIQTHHATQLIRPFYAAALEACAPGQTPVPTLFRYPYPRAGKPPLCCWPTPAKLCFGRPARTILRKFARSWKNSLPCACRMVHWSRVPCHCGSSAKSGT